jgi:hypothetical protein
MNPKQHNQPPIPRGKTLFESFKLPLRLMIQDFLLVIIFLLAGACIAVSENVSSFDSKLFCEFLGLAGVQIISAIAFFKKVRHWKKWIAILSAILTLAFIPATVFRFVW